MNWKTTREWTNKILDAMEEHVIDARVVAEMCLSYMSEDDVKDMCQYNDVFQEEAND